MKDTFKNLLNRKCRLFQSMIQQELKTFWSDTSIIEQSGIRNIQPISPFIPAALAAPSDFFFKNNSKKLRPILGHLLLSAFTKNYTKDQERCLIYPEILHSASLIVDDIEDSADIRRGKPCLHIKYGTDIAVNLANGLYFFPFFAVNSSRLAEKSKLAVIKILTEAMNRIHLGQGLDILWHNNSCLSVTPAQYELMARLKTSSFFRAEAQLAMLFSNAKPDTAEKAIIFAEDIGVAFQIVDDVLDLTAGKKFGKSFAQDITEGKKTLIASFAFERASQKEKADLTHILKQHSRQRALAEKAIRIFHKYNCIQDAGTYAEKLLNTSWKEFSKTLKPSPRKDNLQYLCEFITKRNF